ncbi:MAG: hypothetical protein M1831_006587 [Alyxoria varia]|nr:MAG: hypothetical protein M1831_006587 [Alyxoria varia]
MVLDDASPTASPESENPSAARSGSAAQTAAAFQIPTNIVRLGELPKGLPIARWILGHDSGHMQIAIVNSAFNASALLQRPLNADEWRAVAYHRTRADATSTWSIPISIGLAWWSELRTRKTAGLPWPFRGLRPAEGNTEQFLNLRGDLARHAWMFLRRACYFGVSGMIVLPITFVVAQTLTFYRIKEDPRLKEYSEAMRDVDRSENVRRINIRRDVERHRIQNGVPPLLNQVYDDSSSPSSPEGFMNVPSTDGSSSYENGSSAASQPMENLDPQRDDRLDVNDAPPMAGSQSGESSWERIRRERASGQPPKRGAFPRGGSKGSPRDESDGESKPDSSPFPSIDEERQLAKGEAQKDFDHRIERERQGRDFEDQERRRR